MNLWGYLCALTLVSSGRSPWAYGRLLSSTLHPRELVSVENVRFHATDASSAGTDLVADVVLAHGDAETIRFRLTPNREIVSPTINVQHLLSDGTYRTLDRPSESVNKPTAFYKGAAFLRHSEGNEDDWTKVGWARLSHRVLEDRHHFQGVFRVRGVSYRIGSESSYLKGRLSDDPDLPGGQSSSLVVWRDWDRNEGSANSHGAAALLGERASAPQDESPSFCGTSDGLHDARSISPRQFQDRPFNPLDVIGSTEGCPSARRAALVGVAADCTYAAEFSSLQDAQDNIIEIYNEASQVYEDAFNISLVLQNLTISDPSCPVEASQSTPWNVPCSSSFDISTRLTSFSAWRGQFQDTNAIWSLLSACNSGNTVGIAWLGVVCSTGVRTQNVRGRTQSVAATNVVVRTRSEWQVVAHEIGHNFGATHDCTSATCSGGTRRDDCCPLTRSTCDAREQYLMNPNTGSGIEDFSPCSIGTICTGIGNSIIDTSCFVNPDDAPDISQSECGNGIVEGSEECDCGGEEGCPEDSCCNPTTCQLRENADCDPTNDLCCTDSCRLRDSGFVCRRSTGSCDPEEVCSGSSAQCPEDAFERDGRSCGDSGGLACASGQCTSRDLQCFNAYNETEGTVDSCNSNTCQLSCNVPGQGCMRTSQDFLDGTPCGNGRRCNSGNCERAGSGGGGGGGNGNNGGGAGSWFDQNRTLVIGLVAGIGGLIVIIIVGCMLSSFRHKRNAKRLSKAWPQGGGQAMVAQYVQGHRPPQYPAERVFYR